MVENSHAAVTIKGLYQPLDMSRREIRLLQLHPGTAEANLSGTLYTVPLPPIPIDFDEQVYSRELDSLQTSISQYPQQGQAVNESDLGRWNELKDALNWLLEVRQSIIDMRARQSLVLSDDSGLGVRSNLWQKHLPHWWDQLEHYRAVSFLSLPENYEAGQSESGVGAPSGSLETEIALSAEELWSTSLEFLFYEAVSYCWGNTKTRSGMLLNGIPFQAPWSAVEVLRQLRSADEYRTLWIDAICINQEDIDERGNQVSLMRDVYGNSARTLVWLGHEDDQTKNAIRLVRAIARKMSSVNHSKLTTMRRPGLIERVFHKAVSSVLGSIFERHWFTRLWVYQEVVLFPHVSATLGIIASIGDI